MNIELLRKIAAVIQEKPTEFQMAYLHAKESGEATTVDCGTAHCIAGWTEVITDLNCDASNVHWIWGVSKAGSSRLCFVRNWPTGFRDDFHAADNREARGAIAAARIEHFIETGGTE